MQRVKDVNTTGRPGIEAPSFRPVRPPVATVTSSLVDALRALRRDETSGGDLKALTESLSRARDFALGEKIAHGMVVTFGTGTAQIHISNTEIKPILQSLREYGHKLSDCIERYQQLLGMTPSKAGFRVFSLVLKKVIADDPLNRELKTVCNEALEIDLRSPENPQWKRQVVVPINGVDTKITLSLTPIPLLSKAVLRAMQTDVPLEDRHNRYGYQVKLEPEIANESVALRSFKARMRQALALTALTGPMIMTTFALSTVSSAELLPQLSAHPVIQELLGEATKFLMTASAGVASFAADRVIARRRLLSDTHPRGDK
jgi:hypothetical protein